MLLLLAGALTLLAGAPRPAPAQTVEVQNGATLRVQNSAVFGLEDGQMDLGPAGATARLEETSAGRVAGGTLTATRTLGSPEGADPAGLGAVLSASVDLGDVTVTRGHAAQTASNGNSSIKRYYDISPSQNNAGLSAELTFTYNDDELATLSGSESDLELFKSTNGGSTWSEEGVDSRDAQANAVTLSGIRSFSRWTLGSESSPLPVELAQFEATRTDAGGAGESEEAVRLTWQTASESGNAGFEIQRRIPDASGSGGRNAHGNSTAGTWEQVGFRKSKAPGGTTTEAQTYRFTDTDLPYAADTLAYRLRQVDVSGAAQTTDPVRVARGGLSSLQLEETYPNPARSQVAVRYGVPESFEGEATLRLYDMLGRRVRSVQVNAEGGRHKQTMSVQALASGTYVLRLTAGGEAKTRKLTVVQ